MPTYDYECTKCGHTFEEFQSITAPPRSRCPQCRGRVQRLLSGGAGIVFRGSGWYAKDSKRPAGRTNPVGSEEIATKSTSEETSKGAPEQAKNPSAKTAPKAGASSGGGAKSTD